jgi:hypothetical protein
MLAKAANSMELLIRADVTKTKPRSRSKRTVSNQKSSRTLKLMPGFPPVIAFAALQTGNYVA